MIGQEKQDQGRRQFKQMTRLVLDDSGFAVLVLTDTGVSLNINLCEGSNTVKLTPEEAGQLGEHMIEWAKKLGWKTSTFCPHDPSRQTPCSNSKENP